MVKVKLLALENSFASHERAAFWSDQNDDLPNDVPLLSHKRCLFRCGSCHHIFRAIIRDVVTKDSWCSFCSGHRRCPTPTIAECKTCWDKTFAVSPRALNWSTKNVSLPQDIAIYSQLKFFFDCTVCLHEFQITPEKIARDQWCPFCSNRQRCPPGKIQSCTQCWKKSFASHERARYWSRQNTTLPCEVALNSSKPFWFNCKICAHVFDIPLSHVVRGNWCSFCQNLKRCPPEKIQNCESCYRKCFASHPKAAYWSDRNHVLPCEVALYCNELFGFKCNDCNHEFEACLAGIVAGSWCPFCANKSRCQPDLILNCSTCLKKTFATHERSEEWSNRNDLCPWQVALHSGKKFWFRCKQCEHEFEAALNNVLKVAFAPFAPT